VYKSNLLYWGWEFLFLNVNLPWHRHSVLTKVLVFEILFWLRDHLDIGAHSLESNS
jgi:hypothetical protein